MPNHIQNRVHLVGDESTIEQVCNFIKGKEIVFDFNTVITMPEELNITSDGWLMPLENPFSRGANFYKHINDLKQHLEKFPELREDTESNFIQGIKNFLKYGFATWFEWCVENWGTKWNAYSQDDSRNTSDTIFFQTAWSAPIPVLVALSKKFPTVNFVFAYADEDSGANVAHGVIKEGEFVELVKPENYSAEAYEVYFQLHPEKRELFELIDGTYVYKDDDDEEVEEANNATI